MFSPARFPFLILAALIGWAWAPISVSAHDSQLHHASDQMRQAAAELLASLSPELQEQIRFPFEGAQRTDWHYVPKERVGVPMKAMSLEQRRAARKLMRSALSDKGYLKATTIMSLELVLRTMEAGRENVESIRDPEKYWFALYGEPASDKPWGWRVEGHHLSLNFTSDDGLVASVTPLFLGANPAEVRVGERAGLRVLGSEEDAARELMASLSHEQRDVVLVSEQAPGEVLTVPGEPIDLGEPMGLPMENMSVEQQELMKSLIAQLVQVLKPELANAELRSIKTAGYGQVFFAWAGSLDPEENHYFRLHGPTFVVEYDNAQGNHVHLVWHSTTNDFGLDTLKRHYEESHQHAAE